MSRQPMPYSAKELIAFEDYSEANVAKIKAGEAIWYDDSMLADKHLTGIECAAEYWHAAYYALVPIVQSVLGDLTVTPEIDEATRRQSEEAMIWHRFATHPHAGEKGYQ